MRRFYFTVSVPQVPEVSVDRFREYIREAVSAWGGQFEPQGGGYPGSPDSEGDPLGPPCPLMEAGAVRVVRQTKPRPDEDDREILRKALDALEGLYHYCPESFAYMPADQAISIIKERLARWR